MKTSLLFSLFLVINLAFAQRPDFLKKDSIQSSLDGNVQVFYFDKSTVTSPQPLVVELHSWSNSADSQKDMVAAQAHAKGWNYIFPNFRGVNNHPKACCSEFVIADIDEAIDWALKNMKVDKKKIYIVGNSGGGYATMSMYMKSRHNIASFSAWSSISDLSTWYVESVERKNRYGPEIVKCTGAGEVFDAEKAKERSPFYWKTPLKKRKKSTLQIYAGIHDGYTGSVPISHSINFYNKLLTDANEKDKALYVSEADAATMLKTQTFPTQNPAKTIENRAILYQKTSKKITLTIFEGTHEILKNAALDLIPNTHKHK
ncbi:alpha/beta fold hydrolase [Runella sp.]|jgi:pimeloyl-ACP methyl ester carboxylesterase|uniref:alpha/beta hydrolase family protein n=1 Tax=Runella sp. TaxID=1960881 RepID=UPI00261A9731|nr:alpha/beta fold hydrolase [Runella sp.]